MDLIKKIHKHSLFILIPLAVLSAFIEWRKLPVSVLIGGLLGILNIKALAWGIGGLLSSHKATGTMIFFSMFRLFIFFVILTLLVYLKLVNIFGILAGFTVVFTMLIVEGLRYAKKADK